MPRNPAILIALLTALLLPACFQSRRGVDVARTPDVDTGLGATILMPGQSAPPPRWSRAAAATPAEGAPAGAPAPQPRFSSVGGAGIDETRHERGQEDPIVLKALAAPFVLLAKPFVAAARAVRGKPEPEAAPKSAPRAAPKPPPVDYETQRIREMERELAMTRAPAPGPSIADELAALQRATAPPQTRGAPAPKPREQRLDAPAPPPPRRGLPVADGIVDRDDDGRVDVWIYRKDGQITRKTLDEDFDGHPDTTFHYDETTHQVSRVEEDGDEDGAVDAWTDYRDGRVIRRRVDADRDGNVDTWTFYRDGEIARHEEDTDGDGFRDRVSFYEGGHLARVERDLDGDGRTDETSLYDEAERLLRRDEDTDRDGRVDVVSHYEQGRLARRELLTP